MAAGYEGPLDLSGFNVRLDPESGRPVIGDSYTKAPLDHPDDLYWERGPNVQGVDDYVEALAVYGGFLIAGGRFEVAGDTIAYRIAAWNGSSWSPLGSGVNNEVLALCVYDDKLIAGGKFDTAGGVSADHIAAWDGSAWSSLGSGVNNTVHALSVYNDKLMVGGRFCIAGNKVSAYFARWNEGAPTAVLITGFYASPVENGIALTWSLNADERIEGFRICRSRGDDTTERFLNEHLIDPAERRYVDKTALPGERYRYTLVVLGAECGEVRSFSVEAERPPLVLRLFQNHPNPFNPATSIRYTVPRKSHVAVDVYSSSGRLIRTLIDEVAPAGTGEVTWDGTNNAGVPVASGVYFCRLCVGKVTVSRKMLLLR